jgi:hypothetical protein
MTMFRSNHDRHMHREWDTYPIVGAPPRRSNKLVIALLMLSTILAVYLTVT